MGKTIVCPAFRLIHFGVLSVFILCFAVCASGQEVCGSDQQELFIGYWQVDREETLALDAMAGYLGLNFDQKGNFIVNRTMIPSELLFPVSGTLREIPKIKQISLSGIYQVEENRLRLMFNNASKEDQEIALIESFSSRDNENEFSALYYFVDNSLTLEAEGSGTPIRFRKQLDELESQSPFEISIPKSDQACQEDSDCLCIHRTSLPSCEGVLSPVNKQYKMKYDFLLKELLKVNIVQTTCSVIFWPAEPKCMNQKCICYNEGQEFWSQDEK